MHETGKSPHVKSGVTETLDHLTGLPLEDAILKTTAKVGVIGLGYVGLPLIRTFVTAGFQTLGFDVDAGKVESLLAGRSYIEHIASEWIGRYVSEGTFAPTADMGRLAEADAMLICVPTPLNQSRDPDLAYMEATAREIAGICGPANWWCWRARPIPARRAKWCCRSCD